MNLSAIAIQRPVFTVMVTLSLLVLGALGLSRLGTDLFPDVSFPVVTVNIVYLGASPTEVENQVSKPLEDAVISLNGIDRVQTQSREGLSTTLIIFKLGVDIQEAATEVRERVAQVRFKLPAEIKEPAIARFDVAAVPVLTYTLHGPKSLSETRKFADDVIRPALEQIDGVAAVDIKGGADREIHVDLDRSRIESLGLSPELVVRILRAGNLTVPSGHFDEAAREISVRAIGEIAAVEGVRDLVVTTAKDGSSVRLRDIARVEDGFEDLRTRIRSNREEAVAFQVVKQSGRNTVAVADLTRVALTKLEKSFPPGMKAELIIDQSTFIRENAREVEISIVFGGAMAILIILVFMLDIRSTIISAFALPTSVVATFFLMYALGFTLNMMTLLGLSLAIGLLIDDAVVVRENIFKHLERGEPPREAALRGTEEISLSVLATTLTIVAVFVPIAFMTGIVGQFFRQFGLTVSAAVMVSLFVAFTLDPMLSSRFSKTVRHGARDPFAVVKRPFEIVFAAMDSGYKSLLTWALTHRLAVFLLAIGGFVGVGFLTTLMGSDFMAPEDRGQIVVEIEFPAGTSLEETGRRSATIEQEILANPNFRTVFVTLGPNGDVNKAAYRVLSGPKNQRKAGLAELKGNLRDILSRAHLSKVVVTDPPIIEGIASQAPIMILCRGTSYDELSRFADQVGAALNSVAGVSDVQVRYNPGRPELRVSIDRQRAADVGLSVAEVALALRTSMEGEEAGKLRQGKDEVPIRVRLQESDRKNPDDLARIMLRGPKGLVALADIARLDRGEGPQVIERENRMRQIAVWGTPNGRSLGEIVQDLKPKIAAIKAPSDITYVYDGMVKQMNESNESMGVALLLGVVFIYLVLASQFESFIHPFTIMLTLPLAIVGAILGLFLSKNSVAMGSLIGIILLMGLVTKNAILLVDRAIVRVRDEGEPPYQAILEAGPERLRPILMTSAAMVLGMLPTALSNGEGSEFRAPMSIAVIGGVISSTLLSLIVVPVVYLTIENAKGRLGFGKKRLQGPAAPSPAE